MRKTRSRVLQPKRSACEITKITSKHGPPLPKVAMEQDLVATATHVRAAWGRQTVIASDKQRARLRPGALHIRRCRKADVVLAAAVAIGAEEEEVGTVRSASDAGSLNKWAIGVVTVQDLDGVALESAAVSSDGLKHDRRGLDGRDAVAAVATMADGVAVNLVGKIGAAVDVDEVRWINGAALAERAD